MLLFLLRLCAGEHREEAQFCSENLESVLRAEIQFYKNKGVLYTQQRGVKALKNKSK